MNRQDFLKVVVLALYVIYVLPSLAESVPNKRIDDLSSAGLRVSPVRPNIIFIMADDLGYGQVGFNGQKMVKTPCLDKMAGEGIKLTDYYCGTSVCAPSRCSLMTGLHVGHCYIRGNKEYNDGQEPILADTITVAEKMKEAGYKTAIVGKWGLGYPGSEGDPNNQGFDFFFGYNDQKHAHNYFTDFLWKNDQKVMLNNANGAQKDYSHYHLTREARNFIAENKSNPFFLYLAYTIPHSKMQIPDDDECYKMYDGEDWPDVQKRHAGMISRMDKDIGGILEQLKDLGIDGNTLVIFTSDNGPHQEGGAKPAFFEPENAFRGIKRDMYEGGIRVPFAARWPGVIKAGTESNLIAAHWDFMATACELAGVQAPGDIDSISYLNTLKGDDDKQARHEYVYFELHDPDRRGLRMGDWVALQQHVSSADPNVDSVELYNLKDDIYQRADLAVQYPEKISEFKKLFVDAYRPSPVFQFGKSGKAKGGSSQVEAKGKGKKR